MSNSPTEPAPMTPEEAVWFASTFDKPVFNVERAVLGKSDAIRLTLAALLSGGHVLLEDVPGTGKTLLAKSLANTVSGTHSRIQFMPDLLPSDVTGVSVLNMQTSEFKFRKGPVFATIVLADEINRASPKTQSALLEVMEESQVTVDGTTHQLGSPFMIIATQNVIEQSGTYRLPEAQLDRFLLKTSLGYPSHDATLAIMADAANRNRATQVEPLITTRSVNEMADYASRVHIDPSVLSYVAHVAEETRQRPETKLGLSVRGCVSYVRLLKTWAASLGRNYVTPDDVKMLAGPVMSHRISITSDAQFAGTTGLDVVELVLKSVPAPPDPAR